MKLRAKLNNTERRLLRMVVEMPMVPVGAMVWSVYPNSMQPEKKAATFTRHLRSLEERGLVHWCGNGYIASQAAKKAVTP